MYYVFSGQYLGLVPLSVFEPPLPLECLLFLYLVHIRIVGL